MQDILFTERKSTQIQIETHLKSCDILFKPKLSSYTNIKEYANKIVTQATTFEAWHQDTLIGLVAAYFNSTGFAFITNVSVLDSYSRQGIANKLVLECIAKAQLFKLSEVLLEVDNSNLKALAFYDKLGFKEKTKNSIKTEMLFTIPR